MDKLHVENDPLEHGDYTPNDTPQYSSRTESSATPLTEPQISYCKLYQQD
jgi:hypothetical protein